MKRFSMMALVALVAACGSTTVDTGSTSGTTGGTTTGAGGAGGTTSTTTTTTTGAGGAGGGACSPACDLGFTCCGGACVNLLNDIHNCGMCAHECSFSDPPFCGGGTCGDAPCDSVMICKGSEFCCGTSCCAAGQLCCEVQGPGPSMGPACADPVDGTCPKGCPACQ